METKFKTGAIVSSLGALFGIIGTLALMVSQWWPMVEAEYAASRGDEDLIVIYIIPALGDCGVLGGLLWAIAALGFARKKDWAWLVGVTGCALSIFGSFFPMVPQMSRGMAPTFGIVFFPNLVFYFIMLGYVKPVRKGVLWLDFIAGMAFVLTFMNGVAATDRTILGSGAIYVAVQRLNWVASAGLGLFVVGLLARKKPSHILGIGASLLGVIAGAPLAILGTIEAGSISLFSPAPLLSLVILVILLLPKTESYLEAWFERKETTGQPLPASSSGLSA